MDEQRRLAAYEGYCYKETECEIELLAGYDRMETDLYYRDIFKATFSTQVGRIS